MKKTLCTTSTSSHMLLLSWPLSTCSRIDCPMSSHASTEQSSHSFFCFSGQTLSTHTLTLLFVNLYNSLYFENCTIDRRLGKSGSASSNTSNFLQRIAKNFKHFLTTILFMPGNLQPLVYFIVSMLSPTDRKRK